MKKIKLNNKKGILFWITGLSGSGKTTIAKKILPQIKKNYGPTIYISGDEMRNFFNLKGYSRKERLKIGLGYSDFAKFITNQGFNILFAVIGLFDTVRKHNKRNIQNYLEIYIQSEIKNLIKFSKKKHYQNKQNLVWGLDIKPQFPKNLNLIIKNDFKKSPNLLSKVIIKKLKNIIKK